jgi:hypothetical protein
VPHNHSPFSDGAMKAPAGTTWVFARRDQHLTICKSAETVLTISGVLDAHRRIAFHTLEDLLAFQSGFERHLITTGWSLVAFSPDRRPPHAPHGAPDRPKGWLSRLLKPRRPGSPGDPGETGTV